MPHNNQSTGIKTTTTTTRGRRRTNTRTTTAMRTASPTDTLTVTDTTPFIDHTADTTTPSSDDGQLVPFTPAAIDSSISVIPMQQTREVQHLSIKLLQIYQSSRMISRPPLAIPMIHMLLLRLYILDILADIWGAFDPEIPPVIIPTTIEEITDSDTASAASTATTVDRDTTHTENFTTEQTKSGLLQYKKTLIALAIIGVAGGIVAGIHIYNPILIPTLAAASKELAIVNSAKALAKLQATSTIAGDFIVNASHNTTALLATKWNILLANLHGHYLNAQATTLFIYNEMTLSNISNLCINILNNMLEIIKSTPSVLANHTINFGAYISTLIVSALHGLSSAAAKASSFVELELFKKPAGVISNLFIAIIIGKLARNNSAKIQDAVKSCLRFSSSDDASSTDYSSVTPRAESTSPTA